MKALGSTEELRFKPLGLRETGVMGTVGGAVKCVEIGRNARGESESLAPY